MKHTSAFQICSQSVDAHGALPSSRRWCLVRGRVTGGVPDHSDASRCYPTTRPPPRAHAQLMTRLPVCNPSLTNARAHCHAGQFLLATAGRSSWALPLLLRHAEVHARQMADGTRWTRARPAAQAADSEVLSISPSSDVPHINMTSDSNAERSSARQNRAMSAPVALHAKG